MHTTTPDADLLFKIMRDMIDDNVEYLVIEITSHSLIQKRVHGINLIAAAVTNITPEHLDAHGSYEQLVKDKALIFNMSQSIFLNPAGLGFEEVKKYFPLNIHLVEVDVKKECAVLDNEFSKKYPGEYNLQNASLAIAIGKYLGLSEA